MIDLNPISFINNYVKHNSIDNGLSDFKLYPFQEEMVNNFHNNRLNICVSSRQSGKSSVPLYYLLYRAIFNDFSNIAIISRNQASASDLLERLKYAYKNIFDVYGLMPPSVLLSNRGTFELSNGSRIIASGATESKVKGNSFSDILLDEFAFVPYKQAKDFVKLVRPYIGTSKVVKVIMTSTKNKGSYFDVLCRYGKKSSNPIVVSEYNWDVVPGRDEEWKNNTISMIGKENFEREYVV